MDTATDLPSFDALMADSAGDAVDDADDRRVRRLWQTVIAALPGMWTMTGRVRT